MNKKSIQKVLMPLAYSVWVIGVFIGVSFGLKAFLQAFAPESLKLWLYTPLGNTVFGVMTYSAVIAMIVMPLYKQEGYTLRLLADRLSITKFDARKMFVWALFAWGLSMLVGMIVVMILTVVQVPGLKLNQPQEVGFTNMQYVYEYVLAFFLMVIVAPVFEELMFRGYLYGQLRRVGGFVSATVLTSLAFALLHFQPNVVINVFVLSLFLCYLREKFDSIWAGVLLHAFKNGLAYTLLFILPLYGMKLV